MQVRETFEKRPMLLLGTGLIIGLTLLTHPLHLLAFTALFFLRRPGQIWLLGGIALGLLLTPAPLSPVLDRAFVHGRAQVVSVPHETSLGFQMNIQAEDRTWQANVPESRAMNLGDLIDFKGIGHPLREGSERYLALHGVSGRLDLREMAMVQSGPVAWRWAGAWRTSFAGFCDRWMTPEASSLTKALCFDMTGSLGPEVTNRLKETGTVHLVSASGLQVFVLGFSALLLLGLLPIPRGYQLGGVAALLLFYAAATGFNPPVVRAALMSAVGSFAYLFRREADPLSALGLTASLYLIVQPREVYDPGFQLSFLVVGALLLFAGGSFGRPTLRNRFIDSLRLGWIAFLASAPLVAYHFGTLSLAELPANAGVGLAASAAIVSALFAHLISFVSAPVGGGMLILLTQSFVGWILWMTEHLGGQSWSSIRVPGFSAYLLVPIYGALLLTWRPRIVHP